MGFHSLTIGASALNAANYGLQVTGQNLSNVNTTGYSRQVMVQSGTANSAAVSGGTTLGSGVSIKSVAQVTDIYAQKQLRQATSADSYFSHLESCYTNIQSYFNEPGNGNALSDYMDSFWNSLSDLSSHVETLALRTTALQDALSLTQCMNDLQTQLRDYRQSVNGQVKESVTDVNTLLDTIADLNAAIVSTECGGLNGVVANDLRDQRESALLQLSEIMDVDVQYESNGSAIVALNGRNLVYYDQTSKLAISNQMIGDTVVAVPVFARDGYPISPSSGTLAAQMEIRDEILVGYMDDLDQLASTFTWEFNRAYSQTRANEPYSSMTSLNSPVDSTVTLDQLTFRESTAEGTFQVTNGTLEVVIFNKNTGQEETVKIEIDVDGRLSPSGEPDMILWDPANPDASNSFINRLQSALDSKVAGAFSVSIDAYNHVTIEAVSSDYGFCFGEDTSGILAALGMNTFFTGFSAADIGVNENLMSDPSLMGTGYSFESGDNTGVLALYAFRTGSISRLGNMSPEEYYQNLTGRLGSEASRVCTQASSKADLKSRMFQQRESVSGVNEDEEALNLMAYQRAYQSAAKFITTIDEMYETLLAM